MASLLGTEKLATHPIYGLAGALLTTALPNGTTETRTYGGMGRLHSVVTTKGSATIASFTYGYSAGRKTSVTEGTGRVVQYTYDGLGRLTQERVSDPGALPETVDYTYDLAGNRLSATDSRTGVITRSLYDADDRLTEVDAALTSDDKVPFFSPTATYTYDANGSRKTVTRLNPYGAATGTTTYDWDLAGRMAGTTESAGGQVLHTTAETYDDAGDRTSETADGVKTAYLNDPNQAYDQVLEEYAPGGVLAATYVRGLDLLFQDRGGVRSFYAKDALGSTRALTDANGTVTDTLTYTAYGELDPAASTGTTANEFGFAGYQADAPTGLLNLRDRWLDAAAGRFTSADSYEGNISDPITRNHYAYTGGDPVNNTDPSGHDLLGLAISVLDSVAYEVSAFSTRYQPAITSATTVAGYAYISSGVLLALQENDFLPANDWIHAVFVTSGVIFQVGLGLESLSLSTVAITTPLRGSRGGQLYSGAVANSKSIADRPSYAASPPYAASSLAAQGTIANDTQLVRVYNASAPTNSSPMKGPWVMPRSDVIGLTPVQLQQKYALPNLPTDIVDVNATGLPARVGFAGPNFGAQGGGLQIQLLDYGAWFTKPRPIDGVAR